MSPARGGLRAAWKKHRAIRRVKEAAFQARVAYFEGRLDNEFSGTLTVATVLGLAAWALYGNVAAAWTLIPVALMAAVLWRLWRLLGKAQDEMERAGLRAVEPPGKASPEQAQAAKDAVVAKMWGQAMASGDPVAMRAVAATREETQGERVAGLREGGAEPGTVEPETSQERDA